LAIADARVATFTDAEIAAAEERLTRRAGPVAARVRAELEATFQATRAELNDLAGGQASQRVMLLAHYAMTAAQALQLQTLLASAAFGEETDSAERQLRNQAGLGVVATDLLNKAYEAARAEGAQNKGSVTDQLMNRLGVAAREVPTQSPFGTPGVGSIGSPATVLPSAPKDSE
jgi:hypothetical protein